MREVLCKGKRTDNGLWAYGVASESCNGYAVIFGENMVDKYLVFAKSVCRYTGIVDKNGSKIFKNDMVGIAGQSTIHVIGDIVYNGDGAYFEIKDAITDEMFYCDCSGIEVLGTIYDNPELLEDGEQNA